MRMKRLVLSAAAILAFSGFATALAQTAASYEDLQKVRSNRFDQAFLLPETDFRPYRKVMIDTPEVAFEKNWLRDYNRDQSTLSMRLSDADAEKILKAARDGVAEIYADAFSKGGYQVVTQAGPDVLRVRTAVVNLAVNAPETNSPGRSRSYAPEAGRARLIVEVRDSMSGALLGLAVDDRYVGDSAPYVRDSVTNRADFEQAFRHWARISVDALDHLKSLSPVGPAG